VDNQNLKFHGTGSPCLAKLAETSPGCDETAARVRNNVFRLTFDGDITQPSPGDILIQEAQPDGEFGAVDLSGSFSYSVEGGNVLRVAESGDALGNETWYSIRNTGGWANVAGFEVKYVVVYGDADGNGTTGATDISDIWGSRGAAPDDSRFDMDGNGTVGATDVSDAWGSRGSSAPDEPSGHPCSP
jgi:hypothetical protein